MSLFVRPNTTNQIDELRSYVATNEVLKKRFAAAESIELILAIIVQPGYQILLEI